MVYFEFTQDLSYTLNDLFGSKGIVERGEFLTGFGSDGVRALILGTPYLIICPLFRAWLLTVQHSA